MSEETNAVPKPNTEVIITKQGDVLECPAELLSGWSEHPQSKRVTPELAAWIVERRLEGWSALNISRATDYSKTCIVNICKKSGKIPTQDVGPRGEGGCFSGSVNPGGKSTGRLIVAEAFKSDAERFYHSFKRTHDKLQAQVDAASVLLREDMPVVKELRQMQQFALTMADERGIVKTEDTGVPTAAQVQAARDAINKMS